MVKYHEKNYGNVIVNDFRDFLWDRDSAENTIDNYCRGAKVLVDFMGIKDISSIRNLTKRNIKDFIEYLKGYEFKKGQKYTTETINNKVAGINQFLEYHHMDKLKAKSLYCQRKTFIDDNKIFNNDEIGRMIEESKKVNILLYFVLRILIQMGLRVSEIRFVTVESLNRKFICVYNKGTLRKVPLPTDLREELIEYCSKNGIIKGSIISVRNNSPMDRTTIGRNIKKLAKKLGIESSKAHPHSFRHSFAVNYLKQYGNDRLSKLADILGHRSIETTRIYLRDTLTNASNSLTASNLKIKIAS